LCAFPESGIIASMRKPNLLGGTIVIRAAG
jgi:hypothetical protein